LKARDRLAAALPAAAALPVFSARGGAGGGIAAGLILILTTEFAWNAQDARTDMVFAFFTTAAGAAFRFANASQRRAKAPYPAAFALTGLAFRTEGPVAVAAPLAAMEHPAAGGFGGVKRVPRFRGLAVFGAVILPWPAEVKAHIESHPDVPLFTDEDGLAALGEKDPRAARGRFARPPQGNHVMGGHA